MSLFDSIKGTLHGTYKSMMETVTTEARISEFNEKGTLTPQEYVIAGDHLVNQCPTWTWEEGDVDQKWSFLQEKQFLKTRKVPCLARVASLLQNPDEKIVENGEWLAMDDQGTNQTNDEIADIDLDNMQEIGNNTNSNIEEKKNNNNNNSNLTNESKNKNNGSVINIVEHSAFNKDSNNINNDSDDSLDESFEEIPDIETFDDNDNIVSKTNEKNNNKNKPNIKNTNKNENKNDFKNNNNNNDSNINDEKDNNSNDSNNNNNNNKNNNNELIFKLNQNDTDTIMKTRTYDISITYDKYYKVPRIWLRGYDENGTPLVATEIFEDISGDHAHKTVTVESHPHLKNVVCAGIHPCRHSEVMKRFMDRMELSGKRLSVEQYLFLFLKFMSAVIPTIEYDFTQAVNG